MYLFLLAHVNNIGSLIVNNCDTSPAKAAVHRLRHFNGIYCVDTRLQYSNLGIDSL